MSFDAALHFECPTHSSELFAESVEAILTRNELLSMATVGATEDPHVNAAFFVHDDRLRLYILTKPTSRHGLSLAHRSVFAAMIYGSTQPFGSSLAGLQMSGHWELPSAADQAHAHHLYSERYPLFRSWAATPEEMLTGTIESRFFRLIPDEMTVLDEAQFGEETLVSARVVRVERTLIADASALSTAPEERVKRSR